MPIARNKNYFQTFNENPNFVYQVGEKTTSETILSGALTFFIRVYKVVVSGSISDFFKSNYSSIKLLAKHNKDPPLGGFNL